MYKFLYQKFYAIVTKWQRFLGPIALKTHKGNFLQSIDSFINKL
jgi:hypothetical protein